MKNRLLEGWIVPGSQGGSNHSIITHATNKKQQKQTIFLHFFCASFFVAQKKWRTKSELKCLMFCLFSTFSKLITTNLKLLQPRKCYLQKDIYCTLKYSMSSNQPTCFCCGNFGCEIWHSMMLRVSSESTWRGDNQVWLETTRGPARHPRIQGSKQGRITDLQKLTEIKILQSFWEGVWSF